jgi:uncharacterized peroxidase-related enzyme
VVHHGAALAEASQQPALAEAVASGTWEPLPHRMRILCRYAVKLTLRPWEMEESDVSVLRAEGFSDRDIVDANQVVSYFNYVNRVADGLGVELERRWPAADRVGRTYLLRDRFSEGKDSPGP